MSSGRSAAGSSSSTLPTLHEGSIRRASLAEACALGLTSTVEFLIDLEDTDLDECGPDGCSPLNIAATWGYVEIVRKLLDAGCDPNQRNEDATNSTALHAAANQEHGPIILALLSAGADAMLEDADGRTACDFASVSDALWPLFAARGYSRTPKDVLIVKRVIHKVTDPAVSDVADATADSGGGGSDDRPSTLPFYSRPGSAYVRSDAVGLSPKLPQLAEDDGGGVDPLGGDDDDDDFRTDQPGASISAIWREGF